MCAAAAATAKCVRGTHQVCIRDIKKMSGAAGLQPPPILNASKHERSSFCPKHARKGRHTEDKAMGAVLSSISIFGWGLVSNHTLHAVYTPLLLNAAKKSRTREPKKEPTDHRQRDRDRIPTLQCTAVQPTLDSQPADPPHPTPALRTPQHTTTTADGAP